MRSIRWWNGGKPHVVTGKVVTDYENGSLLIEDTAGRRFFARPHDVMGGETANTGAENLFGPLS